MSSSLDLVARKPEVKFTSGRTEYGGGHVDDKMKNSTESFLY